MVWSVLILSKQLVIQRVLHVQVQKELVQHVKGLYLLLLQTAPNVSRGRTLSRVDFRIVQLVLSTWPPTKLAWTAILCAILATTRFPELA